MRRHTPHAWQWAKEMPGATLRPMIPFYIWPYPNNYLRWKISYPPTRRWFDRGNPRDAGEWYACQIIVRLGIKEASMIAFALTDNLLEQIKIDAVDMLKKELGNDLMKMILYGSCARGDYSQDSDIDIALLTGCGRLEAKKYTDTLALTATELALKYTVIVNFVCLPLQEFEKNKSWYPYFKNIEAEGKVLYDRQLL